MSDEPERNINNDSPEPAQSEPRARRTPSGAPRSARQQGDGRRDSSQLRRNQEHLGVGSDHKTPTMKKGRRGTFP